MSAVQWQFSASVDGFVAGPGGDMAWLGPFVEQDAEAMHDVVAATAVLLVGGRTFRGDDPYAGTPQEGEAYGGGWAGPQVVLTRTVPPQAKPGITFVADPHEAVATARELAGEGNVGVLGATAGSSLVAAGLVDEILVQYVPVLLGDGVRMFGGSPVNLALKHALTPSLHVYGVDRGLRP